MKKVNLDRKENTKKINKLLINIITIIVIISTASGIYAFYPRIKEMSTVKYDSKFDSNNILYDINNKTLVLYKESLDKISDKNLSVEEAFIKSYDEEKFQQDELSRDNIDFIRDLKRRYSSQSTSLKNDYKSLEYIVLDNNGDEIISNTINPLLQVYSNSNTEELKSLYSFYVAIKYDSDGNIEILNGYGAQDVTIRNSFNYKNDELFYSDLVYDYKIKVNEIKDMTFIYGIPNEFKYDDYLSVRVNQANESRIEFGYIVVFGLIVGSIIILLCLLIPYKISCEIIGNKLMFKVPFEINCFIYGIITTILIYVGALGVYSTIGEELTKQLTMALNTMNINLLINILNIGLWTIIIYFILNGVTLLKHIFKFGFKKYMKENLFIIKIYNFISSKGILFINYLNHIDLTDKSNKVLIKILGINFMILSLMIIIRGIGIGAAFIYTISLYIIARRYYDKVRENFKSLLRATNKIAEGNLDIKIDEDLGIFNPFKDEIEKIQNGFKNAVNEEIKSQRMKTELISNVSHDLKTPLTSIITYVDLLKTENLSEEERKSYIDTLDRKSQRLKYLIEDLFEVSKANSGNVKLNLIDMDIIELIKQTEIELDDKIKESKLTIKNNFTCEKIILNLDSQKTFRVFDNLFNNVLKYAMKNTRVYVDIIENKQGVEITIKNISAVEIDFNSNEIMERFSRGDKSRNTEGSGLGLAIVKSFVELQNGEFDIQIDGDLFKAIVKFKK